MATQPEAHVEPLVLNAVLRSRDVSKINRRAVCLSDDELIVLIGVAQLPLRLKQEAFVLTVELAGPV